MSAFKGCTLGDGWHRHKSPGVAPSPGLVTQPPGNMVTLAVGLLIPSPALPSPHPITQQAGHYNSPSMSHRSAPAVAPHELCFPWDRPMRNHDHISRLSQTATHQGEPQASSRLMLWFRRAVRLCLTETTWKAGRCSGARRPGVEQSSTPDIAQLHTLPSF